LLRGFSPHRWAEYSVSATAQVLLVGVASGIRDVSVLTGLVALHVGVMFCGALSELHALTYSRPVDSHSNGGKVRNASTRASPNSSFLGSPTTPRTTLQWRDEERPRRLSIFFLGCALVVSAWTILILGISLAVTDSTRLRQVGAPSIPPWVLLALFGTLATFFSFAVVHAVYLWRPPSRAGFVRQEMWYQVLSLVSKVYLTGFLLANVLFRGDGPSAAAGKQSFDSNAPAGVTGATASLFNGSFCATPSSL